MESPSHEREHKEFMRLLERLEDKLTTLLQYQENRIVKLERWMWATPSFATLATVATVAYFITQ